MYGSDVNSIRAVRLIETLRPALVITPFSELELLTAFEASVFRKLLSEAEAESSLHGFRSDIATGVLVRQPIGPGCFSRATSISKLHTKVSGSRTLDILQVAIALDLEAEVFFTFDKDQAKLARRAGLAVRPGR